MKVLVIYAHPEPTSLTRQLVNVTAETLSAAGHTVVHSDLYASICLTQKLRRIIDAGVGYGLALEGSALPRLPGHGGA